MSDQNEERDKRSSLVRWAVVLLVVYPASVGPAVFLGSTLGPTGKAVLSNIYYPVSAVYEAAGEPSWFNEYIQWWRR